MRHVAQFGRAHEAAGARQRDQVFKEFQVGHETQAYAIDRPPDRRSCRVNAPPAPSSPAWPGSGRCPGLPVR
ncbi:hypothetical protein G6F59_018150 [Rhizopus arrhizus]|nr:hypothetical protein G6F59_018150 [Rhizopus arrhizus]